MIEAILAIVPITLSIGVLVLSLTLLVFAIYDMVITHRVQNLKVYPLPKITIIIMSPSTIHMASRCLMMVRKLKYRSLDSVIVTAGSSTSDTAAIRKLARKYAHVRHYHPRKTYASETLVHEAYKRSERGSIVVVIDSHMLLSRSTIDAIVRHTADMDAGRVIQLQRQSLSYGLAGVIVTFKYSAYRMLTSLESILKLSSKDVRRHGGYAMDSTFISAKHRKLKAVTYSDAAITLATPRLGVGSWPSKARKAVGKSIGFIGTSVIAVIMILAAIEGSGLEALTASWLFLSIAMILLVLFDSHTNLRQKIETVACAGFMPIMLLIAVITSLRFDSLPEA